MKTFTINVASALALGLLANAQIVPSQDCTDCEDWVDKEVDTVSLDREKTHKCLKTLAACARDNVFFKRAFDTLQTAADKKPVKCKECATMFDWNSKVQHRDFQDCVLAIERGNCPKEFPDGIAGLPSFEEYKDMTGNQKRGDQPTYVHSSATYPVETPKPYGSTPNTYATVEQPKTNIKTQPPVTVTSTLTSPPETETVTCTETETPKAYTEFKTLTETCTETSTLEKYLTATEMKSYPVTVPTTIVETFTKVPECPTITTSCTHWTVSETHPAYPVTHPENPVTHPENPVTHPGNPVTTQDSTKPGYHVTYTMEQPTSSKPSYPIASGKPSYVAPPNESSTEPMHEATHPVYQASTSKLASYPVTSAPAPVMPTYPASNGNFSTESVPPYYKPSASGSKTEMTSASKFAYPTESVISTGDSSKVSMTMGLAFGMVMAAMFVCA